MCPIDLYDTLYFRDEAQGSLTLEVERVASEEADEPLPPPEQNLVIRALELLREDSGCRQGARIRLVKRIPMAAGLAGGSSDAAAALVAGNLGWRLGYSRERLAMLAARLGSDIPFFLLGSPALARGRGERLESCRRNFPLWFVIAKPPAGLSTAAVYKNCAPSDQPRTVGPLVEALERGNLGESGKQLWNRLQPTARTLSPWIERLEREFAGLDLPGHLMSGSGTSYFGLCRNGAQARALAGRLRQRGIGQVFMARACRHEMVN